MTSIPEIRSFELSQTKEKETSEKHKDVSFHGRNFKLLRVLGDSLSSMFIISLGYKIASVACRIFSLKAASHHYKSLASYHWIRGGNRLSAYCFYGKNIINFAFNSSGQVKELSSTNELDLLSQMYKSENFNAMLGKVTTAEIPVLKDKLSRLPITERTCLGSNLDFIFRLLERQKDKGQASSLEDIKSISQAYIKGATLKAQMTQIIYDALDTAKVAKEIAKERQKIKNDTCLHLDALKEQSEKDVLEFNRKKFKELEKKVISKEISPKEIEKHAQKIQENAQKYIEKGVEKGIEVIKKADHDKADLARKKIFTPLAENVYNLKLAPSIDLVELTPSIGTKGANLKSKTPSSEFVDLFNKLDPGAYLVNLRCPATDSYHTVAYIKESQDRGYFYEPSLATLVMPSKQEQLSLIWNITKTWYNTKGKSRMSFYKCSLAT